MKRAYGWNREMNRVKRNRIIESLNDVCGREERNINIDM
jgi:hypothetical protein